MKAKGIFYTALLGLAILLFYGGFATLWALDYHKFNIFWTDLWGVYLLVWKPTGATLPFYDLFGVLSWRDCHLLGTDVMYANPCDPLARLSNYSPLWYLLPIGGRDDVMFLGALMSGSFLVLLPLMIRPASKGELAMSVVAAISSSTLFAVERANVDIVMFLMAMAVVWLWRTGRGWPAYGMVMAAAALKFYPLALFGLAAREPGRRFAIATLVCALSTILFIAIFWEELQRLPDLMPKPVYFGDNFGAKLFGLGMTEQLDLAPIAIPLLTLLLTGLCFWGALRIAACLGSALERSFWNRREGALLLAGALIMVGCFFATANVAYRAIFLLMTLPGFFLLRRIGLKRLGAYGLFAVLFCLNAEPLRRFTVWPRSAPTFLPEFFWGHIPEGFFFLARETIWWSLIALLGGVILTFFRQTPLFAMLTQKERGA